MPDPFTLLVPPPSGTPANPYTLNGSLKRILVIVIAAAKVDISQYPVTLLDSKQNNVAVTQVIKDKHKHRTHYQYVIRIDATNGLTARNNYTVQIGSQSATFTAHDKRRSVRHPRKHSKATATPESTIRIDTTFWIDYPSDGDTVDGSYFYSYGEFEPAASPVVEAQMDMLDDTTAANVSYADYVYSDGADWCVMFPTLNTTTAGQNMTEYTLTVCNAVDGANQETDLSASQTDIII
ncbi:hypothetical protein [Fimbriiglobus ruber]|uniref:Uncharacterized protein n=1 Tax=Fimbriiglobus ruber TaxID=1908690 RepID=A0A225EAA0_9BACT|nr:hypothetical protein [Fimbriiglobus ruber]OWK45337.1 hypothetical protein FRUB_01668 [Fimbriiglobus ruber]